MKTQVVVTAYNNELGAFRRGFIREAKAQLKRYADDVVETARENAKVDTGAYRGSTYAKSKWFNGYNQAIAAGAELNPEEGVFDDVPTPTGDLEVTFAIAMKYGWAVHEGFGPHAGNPNPILRIGMDENQPRFEAVMRNILDSAAYAAQVQMFASRGYSYSRFLKSGSKVYPWMGRAAS